MAVWTDLTNVAYRTVLSSTFVNALLENTRNLKERLDALPVSTDTAWVEPALTGSWAAFGGGFRAAGYRRLGGVVHLRGSIKSGGTGDTNPIMTLPVGFRPSAIEQRIVQANAGIADMRIDTAGRVYIAGFSASGTNAIVGIATTFVPD